MGKALEYFPPNQQSLVVKSYPSPFPSPGQKFPITSSCLCAGLRVGLYMRSRCWLLGMKAQLKLVCMKVIERSEGKGGSSIGRFLPPSCKRLHEVPPEAGWGSFKSLSGKSAKRSPFCCLCALSLWTKLWCFMLHRVWFFIYFTKLSEGKEMPWVKVGENPTSPQTCFSSMLLIFKRK